ncbi:caspase family protein, partial [bacterium]|nr:caspase family protein [bacterium]
MPNSNITLPFAKSHAFIIGINAYEHVSKLSTAVKDATDIAELLKDKKKHGYQTHLLTDGNKVQMLAFFEEMKTTVKKKDRVIFYFAGHGIALDSEGDPEGFLVPVDAEPNDKESLISMNLLHQILNELPCKHGLLILDCCFAGAFKWSTGFRDTVFNFGQKLYAERFRRFVDSPAWQVITSSAHDQKASDVLNKQALGLREEEEQTESKNSPFAWALKQAIDLHSKADVSGFKRSDGVITATELYFYLREIVETSTSDGMKRQSPAIFTLGKHDTKGEYIFLNPGHKLNLPEAPDTNPYKGLGPYEASEADAQAFFGRTEAIKTMIEKLKETSILLVSAPSGQGKSSVVKAGLFSAMQEEGDPKPIILRPGERAFENWDALIDLDPASRQLVLIDQYEEMFDLDEFDGESFEGQLVALMKKVNEAEKPALKLILTLRSDFEWQMTASAFGQTFWQAENIRKFLYRLPPMTPEELREIMVKPAWTVAYEFESEELINQILEEINHSPGALPLLSFTLHKLYEER